jgi:hypothetical protein
MKVRKIVAGLAAVSMLAAFSAQAVFAADSVSIKAGEAKANAGENFKLEVSVEGLPSDGASVMEFAVTYDSSIATITGVTAGEAIPTSVDSAEKLDGVKGFEASYDTKGTVTITYSTGLGDAAYNVKNGVVAVISGTIASGAANNTYPVKIEAISRQTVEGKGDVNTEVKAGLIGADGTVTKFETKGVAGSIIVGATTVDTTEPTKAPDTTEPKQETTAPTEPGEKVEVTMYCDANCDKAIDITDVIAFNKHMLGSQELTAQGRANADVDANGKIEAADGLNILKRVVGNLEDKDFPVKK